MNDFEKPQIKNDASNELIRLSQEKKFIEGKTVELIDQLSDSLALYDEGGFLKSKDKEQIVDAIHLMIRLHIDQKDRPQEPYVNHTTNVPLRLVKEFGVEDPNMIIAALLHDSVEDQSEKIVEILDVNTENEDIGTAAILALGQRYNEDVSFMVRSLSNPKLDNPASGLSKNEIYAEHVRQIIEDPRVALIKLSDFSENALRLGEIEESELRKHLSIKYMPVMKIFTNRLEHADIDIPEELKHQVLQKLDEAYNSAQSFLKVLDTNV